MIRQISQWWERVEQWVKRIEPPQARRIVVAIVGFTVLLIGVAMLVLPGPALVVIPAGLAILGLEFSWARQWLAKVTELAKQAAEKVVPGAATAVEREAAQGRAAAQQMPH